MVWSMMLPEPNLWIAEPMIQFAEYSLSPPRGPPCCVSARNPWPMIIVFQEPSLGINIGMGQLSGLRLVPDAIRIRYIPASFMSPGAVFEPDMSCPAWAD